MRTRSTFRLGASLAFLVLSFASVSWAADELTLFLSVRGAVEAYPVENRSAALYVVFTGQPLVLQVSLVNESDDTIRVGRSGGWIESLTVSFETTDGRTVDSGVPTALVLPPRDEAGIQADPVFVSPHATQGVQLQVQPDRVPPPGVYRVRASLHRADLAGISGRNAVQLSPTNTIEIRPVFSTNDQLNLLYTNATRARLTNRNAEARNILGRLLALRPTSVIAWSELGNAWMADRNCREAAVAFTRSLELLDAGADPEELSAREGFRADIRAGLRGRVESCR